MNAVMISAAMSANRIATQNAVNTAMMAAKHDCAVEPSDDFAAQVLVGTFLFILLGVSFFGLLMMF